MRNLMKKINLFKLKCSQKKTKWNIRIPDKFHSTRRVKCFLSLNINSVEVTSENQTSPDFRQLLFTSRLDRLFYIKKLYSE